ncbi:MAG TPA: hypothetical protein VFS56_09065, partial [Gemmatimonadaceae bacterium]|nr:hypothetical protein [Gemmatimonadaceae bacterium]
SLIALASLACATNPPATQDPVANTPAAAAPMESARAVSGGGISVSGWTGRIDANEARQGQVLSNAKLASDRGALHVTTGPAVAYWKPTNTANGDYTVRATFREPAYMSLNDHPHPYGVFIGGNDMGTDSQSYLYCAANGNGSFIVRGFGPASFQLNGRRGEMHAAVNKAAAKGSPVTNEIAVSVSGDKVQCAINGTVVATYNKSDVVGAGKLKSTDGIYGIRFAHNTEGLVTGLRVTRP